MLFGHLEICRNGWTGSYWAGSRIEFGWTLSMRFAFWFWFVFSFHVFAASQRSQFHLSVKARTGSALRKCCRAIIVVANLRNLQTYTFLASLPSTELCDIVSGGWSPVSGVLLYVPLNFLQERRCSQAYIYNFVTKTIQAKQRRLIEDGLAKVAAAREQIASTPAHLTDDAATQSLEALLDEILMKQAALADEQQMLGISTPHTPDLGSPYAGGGTTRLCMFTLSHKLLLQTYTQPTPHFNSAHSLKVESCDRLGSTVAVSRALPVSHTFRYLDVPIRDRTLVTANQTDFKTRVRLIWYYRTYIYRQGRLVSRKFSVNWVHIRGVDLLLHVLPHIYWISKMITFKIQSNRPPNLFETFPTWLAYHVKGLTFLRCDRFACSTVPYNRRPYAASSKWLACVVQLLLPLRAWSISSHKYVVINDSHASEVHG